MKRTTLQRVRVVLREFQVHDQAITLTLNVVELLASFLHKYNKGQHTEGYYDLVSSQTPKTGVSKYKECVILVATA